MGYPTQSTVTSWPNATEKTSSEEADATTLSTEKKEGKINMKYDMI